MTSAVADIAQASYSVPFIPAFLGGGMLLVLAEVFGIGVRLREDSEGLV